MDEDLEPPTDLGPQSRTVKRRRRRGKKAQTLSPEQSIVEFDLFDLPTDHAPEASVRAAAEAAAQAAARRNR